MYKKKIAVMIISFLLIACGTSAKRLNEVSVGMSKTEVMQILGSPESVRAQGGEEVLIYTLSNSWNSGVWNEKYYVRLINGQVHSYGK